MRLIDMVRQSPRRLAMPLAGYPGVQLTRSTVKQNEFNAELQARSLYKLAERILPDAVFPMMDLSVEAGALGLPIKFPLQESATVEWHPVKQVADLDQFKVVDPLYDGRAWVFQETVRQLSRKLPIPVGGYVIGPFSLAGLMIGASDIALATIDAPDVVRATVNFCEHAVIAYAKALVASGAGVIAILEPTAVILSPDAYWEFSGQSTANVIRHLDTKTVLHICGNTGRLVENMCRTGAQGLSLDTAVSLPRIAPRVDPDIVLIGNINPVGAMLRGGREQVRRDTLELLESLRGVPNFIASTGCDLPAETPIENIAEFCRTVRDWRP